MFASTYPFGCYICLHHCVEQCLTAVLVIVVIVDIVIIVHTALTPLFVNTVILVYVSCRTEVVSYCHRCLYYLHRITPFSHLDPYSSLLFKVPTLDRTIIFLHLYLFSFFTFVLVSTCGRHRSNSSGISLSFVLSPYSSIDHCRFEHR